MPITNTGLIQTISAIYSDRHAFVQQIEQLLLTRLNQYPGSAGAFIEYAKYQQLTPAYDVCFEHTTSNIYEAFSKNGKFPSHNEAFAVTFNIVLPASNGRLFAAKIPFTLELFHHTGGSFGLANSSMPCNHGTVIGHIGVEASNLVNHEKYKLIL
jgi:hypothetical protein